MKTLAIYSPKGGVGKSAAAVNLSYFSAASGRPTLIWDLDAQGASSWYLHGEPTQADSKRLFSGALALARVIQPTPYRNLHLIPSAFALREVDLLLKKAHPPRESLARALAPLADDYERIVLDCPPTLSHLADNVFTAADLVLVPVIPTHLSLRSFEQLRDYFKAEGLPRKKLKPFFSMADRRRQLHREILEAPPALLRGLCEAVVPYSAAVERMGDEGKPLAAYAPADDPALLAYAQLWLEAHGALRKR